MINNVSPIGVYNQNYQMTFRAKGEKAAYEVVDQLHEAAKEITRPLAEKKANLIRRSVSRFLELFKKEASAPNAQALVRERLIHAAKYEGLETEKARHILSMNLEPTRISFSEIRKNAKTLKLIEQINEAHRQTYLQELKERDPEAYKEAVIKYMNEKFATMSWWEKLYAIAKEMLSKS